jgi:hypothetical protein
MNRPYPFLLFLFLLASPLLQAQDSRYVVHLSDKDTTHNPYSLEEPSEYLSQRALERRSNMGIAIDMSDLPVSPRYTDSIRPWVHRIQNRSRWMNLLVVEAADSLTPVLQALSFVDSIQRIRPLGSQQKGSSLQAVQSSDTSRSDEQENPADSSMYGYAWEQIKMLNGHLLHQGGFEGEGLLIAVMDAGFKGVDRMMAFDSLWANNQVRDIRDFEDHDGQIFDAHTHGTMVLSVIAANMPGMYKGTASAADFLLLRTEVSGSEYISEEYNWIAAAEFADSAGADIINSSLGYSTFDDSTQNHSYREMDGSTTPITRAADLAASKGMLVVSSAGNLGNDPWNYIGAPADADSIITVGAVDPNRNYASFSSKGPSFDGRVKPEVAAQGVATVVQNLESMPSYANGTSFSAPIISGLMACLWQKYPEDNNMEIRERLITHSGQYNDPDTLTGYGIPNFSRAAGLGFESIGGQAIEIFPNPFRSSFSIRFPDVTSRGKNLLVEIYDIMGRKIYTQTLQDSIAGRIHTIDALAGHSPGMYLIKISLGQKVIRQEKIVKD